MMIRFLTLFIFPLTIIVFVPWIPDFYDTGRLILTTGLVMMILFFWILSVIRTKRCIFSLNAGSIGFGLLFLTSVISTLVISKNKIEALTNPLGPVLWLDLFLMSTFAPSFLKQEDLSLLRWVTAGCIAFLGLTATYQQFKITSILFPNASYLASNLWNPTGSPVSVILLAIAALPVTALLYRTAVKSHNDRDSAFAIIFFLFDMITICITLWRFLPSAQTVILPLQLGWTVLLETWKQVQYASIGIGAEQFVRAYTAARPVWVNTSPVWNTMFATNATLILHFGVVYGMLGVCACITLCIFLIKNREHSW